MKWISSEGGPLILFPQNHILAWNGVTDDEDTNHYAIACNVEQYIAPVQIGNQTAIVFGDDPNSTCWVQSNSENCFIRWVYADNEQQILEKGLQNFSLDARIDHFEVTLNDEDYLLLDAAYSGLDEYDYLEISLKKGRYEVSTWFYKELQTCLVKHSFRLI